MTETVTVLATTTSLTASPNPAGSGQTVTLTSTVTVAAAAGLTPVGVVTFQNGGVAIGTGTLNGAGIATLALSTLPIGTDILTAVYAGSGSLGGSVSAPVSETIVASALNLVVLPSTLTIKVGHTGSTSVQLASTGGYAGTLSLSATGLPQYVSGTFGSSALALQSNGTANTTLTISTQVVVAALHSPGANGRSLTVMGSLAALMLVPLGCLRRRRLASLLFAVLGCVLIFGISGCTTIGNAIHTVAPGSYTIPITATDGNGNTKRATLTLVLTP